MTDIPIPPMVERVARVLCRRYLVFQGYAAGDLSAPMYWEVENEFGLNLLVLAPKDRRDEGSPAWEWFIEDARAVIEAMREMPADIAEPAFLRAQRRDPGMWGFDALFRAAWGDVIDFALGKGNT